MLGYDDEYDDAIGPRDDLGDTQLNSSVSGRKLDDGVHESVVKWMLPLRDTSKQVEILVQFDPRCHTLHVWIMVDSKICYFAISL